MYGPQSKERRVLVRVECVSGCVQPGDVHQRLVVVDPVQSLDPALVNEFEQPLPHEGATLRLRGRLVAAPAPTLRSGGRLAGDISVHVGKLTHIGNTNTSPCNK